MLEQAAARYMGKGETIVIKTAKFRRNCIMEIWQSGVRKKQDIVDILADKYDIRATTQSVSIDLKALDRIWQRESRNKLKVVKEELEVQYRNIYHEAMTAWHHSLGDELTETREYMEGLDEDDFQIDNGNQVRVSRGARVIKKKVTQSGNAAFLSQAQAALKAIREMYGIDAPKQQTIAWKDVMPEGYESEEVIDQFAALMARSQIIDETGAEVEDDPDEDDDGEEYGFDSE